MLTDRRIPSLLALLVPFIVAGCGPGRAPSAVESASPPVEVHIAAAGTTPTASLTLPARVRAAEEVTLASRAAGRVTRFVALEGETVRAGQTLVRFDAPEAERAQRAARAERDAAQLVFEVSARQHARIESLFVARVIAAADREAANAQHRSLEARLAASEAQFSAATAAREVRAPFDGVVVRRHVDSGADVAAGTALLDLRSRGAVELIVAVPEAALAGLAKATVQYQLGEGAWLAARLVRLDGMIDPTTRTRTAHLVPIENSLLEPGAFARVRLLGGEAGDTEASTWSVPASSVVRRGALTGVFLAEGNHAVLRWLRLGRREGDRIEVLAGLQAGDSVVQQAAGLFDGATLTLAR